MDTCSIFDHLKTSIMNALQNKVQLIGNLGQDPEIKTLSDGKKVATFSMATSENYRNAAGEKVQETQWHRVVAWGRLAELSEKYLKKGRKVAIEGKLTHRDYEDKDGIRRYVTEVVVNEMLLLGNNDKHEEK